MTPDPLLLSGAPGSPYTRKMVAYLRYRRIAHQLIVSTGDVAELPKAKVRLLPTFYLPNAQGELEAVVDSTPLIRRFEREFDGRTAVPQDAVVNFFDALIEDYADEWMTKAMFHYRWYYREDIKKSGDILPRWRNIAAPEAEMQKAKTQFQNRQISRLYVVGSNDVTAPVIEASYVRFLDLFCTMLEEQPFVFGSRPSSADFALYGQLSQLAKFDPTPMALTLDRAPRVFAWVDVIDDLSGLRVAESPSEGWISRDRLGERLGALLTEIGKVYAPVLIANAQALQNGAQTVETSVDGKAWTQTPFPYQGKCLVALRAQYQALGEVDRAVVDQVLDGTGCEVLFAA